MNKRCSKCGKEKETQDLISTFDTMIDKQTQYDISDCMKKNGHLDEQKFIQKYSEDALKEFWFLDQLENTVHRVLLCRDCFYN